MINNWSYLFLVIFQMDVLYRIPDDRLSNISRKENINFLIRDFASEWIKLENFSSISEINFKIHWTLSLDKIILLVWE